MYDDILNKARSIAKTQKPEFSNYRHAAFANSVLTLVAGVAGGFGGPSVREHSSSHLYGGRKYGFDDAVKLLLSDDGPIFGPIADIHVYCWKNEYCFDDDPKDVAELEAKTGISRRR